MSNEEAPARTTPLATPKTGPVLVYNITQNERKFRDAIECVKSSGIFGRYKERVLEQLTQAIKGNHSEPFTHWAVLATDQTRGTLVGISKFTAHPRGKVARAQWMITAPSLHRQGIGMAMLEIQMEFLRSLKIETLCGTALSSASKNMFGSRGWSTPSGRHIAIDLSTTLD